MTTDELIKALRETDFSDGCPCELSEMCKDADCIIMQAANRLEEQDKIIKQYQKADCFLAAHGWE